MATIVVIQFGNGVTFRYRGIMGSADRRTSPLIFWFVIVTQSALAAVCVGMGIAVLGISLWNPI